MHDALSAPHSERVILGQLVIDGMAAMEHCLRLEPSMFHLSSHATLFRECRAMAGEGNDWSLISLLERLEDRKLTLGLEQDYLAGLMETTFQRNRPTEHVERIIAAWKRRRGAELCERYGATLRDGGDADETLSELQTNVLDVIAEAQHEDDPSVTRHAEAVWEDLEVRSSEDGQQMGLSYGCDALDDWTGGMRGGELTVLGARSGVGKSALVCQALNRICGGGEAADFFSFEMDREEVLHRLWSINSGISFAKIDMPRLLLPAEKQHVREAAARSKSWNLRIHRDPGMTIDELVARARMSVRRNGCKLVAVDYAQIVPADGRDDRTRVAAVSTKLRTFAKDEGCHVLLLSQLRKVPPEQYSHPPTAGDLRETGQLENDAHVIVLLHRPWDNEANCIADDASLLIPKFRRGRTGMLRSHFEGRTLTFR